MTPRPYQITGRDFLAGKRHALLADEMRVGKTPQAILACDEINASRVLVVCPAIATHQWVSEWARWSPGRPAATILAAGPVLESAVGVTVVSYNRAVQHLAALTAGPKWDAVIADEAHFAKTPSAKRTKAIYGKGGLGWHAKRLWALTGTPSPNHVGELWPMLSAFGLVRCDYESFLTAYCYYSPQEGRVWGNRPERLGEVRKLLTPITLRRTRADVAPEMAPIQFALMSMAPGKPDLNSDDPEQVDRECRIAVAMAKAPQLAEEIEFQLAIAKNYKQTVVFGYHKEPLQLVRDELAYGGHGIRAMVINGETSPTRRREYLERFKDRTIDVMCVQILAGGTAVDLSMAQHGYFLELDYVPGNNEQAANRLVNMQTGLPVTIDVCTWPGTKDDSVQRTLLRKVKTAVF